MAFGWDDAIGAALAWYMSKQGEKTPNFYNVPLTPEEKYWDDQKKNLWEAGGSGTQQTLRNLGFSYLGQMQGAPSDLNFASDAMKGQKFAGGVTMPTFDMSKLFVPNAPIKKTGGGDDPNDPGKPIPTTTPGGDNSVQGNPYTIGDPNANLNNDAPPIPGGVDATTFRDISAAWNRYKADHPNWAKAGVSVALTALTALTGFPGAIISKALRPLLMRDIDNMMPNPTKSFGDVMKNSPGVKDPYEPGVPAFPAEPVQPRDPYEYSWGDQNQNNPIFGGEPAAPGMGIGGGTRYDVFPNGPNRRGGGSMR